MSAQPQIYRGIVKQVAFLTRQSVQNTSLKCKEALEMFYLSGSEAMTMKRHLTRSTCLFHDHPCGAALLIRLGDIAHVFERLAPRSRIGLLSFSPSKTSWI